MSAIEPTLQGEPLLSSVPSLGHQPDGVPSENAQVPVLQTTPQPDDLFESRIVIVDDDDLVAGIVQRYLVDEGYRNLLMICDSSSAFEQIMNFGADLVITDMMMPKVSGLDLLRMRSQSEESRHIPFIVFSGNSEESSKREALGLGATDFLAKPIDPVDLVLRVKNTLLVKQHQDNLRNYASELEQQVNARTQQIEMSRERIVHCLAKAAEFRDSESGSHVVRVGKYSSVIASQLGFSNDYCKQIELAAQLHDVGKIGIPDSILLNPGRLSREEFEVMKQHCQLGYKIMEPLAKADSDNFRRTVRGQIMTGLDSPLLGLAANIALTHHEKWDGSGYPGNLKQEEIPIEGRITCVADVYDALCSERPYKPRFPREKCLEIMLSERGSRFDPQVLDVFFERLDMIIEIGESHADVIENELR